MDIIIYGAGFFGKMLLESSKKYEDIKVIGFADIHKEGFVDGIPILDIFKDVEKFQECSIVISVANFIERKKIYRNLKNLGFKHIYYYLMKNYCVGNNFLKNECVSLENVKENSLFYAEMAIIDYCNLNCKGCNHYSPIFDRKIPDINLRLSDIRKIKSLYDEIIEFGLIGGEPLLSPQVKEYIVETRKILPNTQIQMVTNGMLIPKISEDILKCIHDNKITIAISEYVPTRKIMDKIEGVLQKYEIDYVIKPAAFKEKFYKTLSLKKDSIYPKKCISHGCINICDGKIAKCPSVLYIDELNRRFGTNLPNQGIYTLADYVDGKELDEDMEKRIPLCDHCINYQFDWEPCGIDKKLDDFVVRD